MSTEGNENHKYLENSNFTYKRVFNFAFNGYQVWDALAKELGEEKFYIALRKVVEKFALEDGKDEATKLKNNDFSSFVAAIKDRNPIIEHATTLEFVEESPTACEVKITECLWAETFRKLGLEKLGYHLFCESDFGVCKGFNPKMSLIRTKTLMQGDDCCNHRYVI